MKTILLTLATFLFMGTADARPHHHKHRKHNVHVKADTKSPKPPPRSTPGYSVHHRHGHWAYPHSNPAFIWRWTPGHYTRNGVWRPGHWRVIIKI